MEGAVMLLGHNTTPAAARAARREKAENGGTENIELELDRLPELAGFVAMQALLLVQEEEAVTTLLQSSSLSFAEACQDLGSLRWGCSGNNLNSVENNHWILFVIKTTVGPWIVQSAVVPRSCTGSVLGMRPAGASVLRGAMCFAAFSPALDQVGDGTSRCGQNVVPSKLPQKEVVDEPLGSIMTSRETAQNVSCCSSARGYIQPGNVVTTRQGSESPNSSAESMGFLKSC
ncbi:hypothetical protein Anapl_01120 [Anas platyrhynchos]|uniref:Uncharacterized protein n=1 Tax=Anas platyrhynchos TaxID=8839 RepID=R0LE34_ANAPL|nr:hypothetical protein Anapl_01120 [Anas platyrhynchos]